MAVCAVPLDLVDGLGAQVVAQKSGVGLLQAGYILTMRNTRRYGGYMVHMGIVFMFIGFTGTPLLKEDAATSREVFGGYIHTYKFSEGVADGVVLDLMIHDIGIVLQLANSEVEKIDAVGVSVVTKTEDIANARIAFRNGCVANLTASRISPERLRKIRVFSGGAQPSYISLDYREQKGFIYRLAGDDAEKSSLLKMLLSANDSAIVSEFAGKKIVREPVPIAKDEPLKLELAHVVECVRERRTPKVSGASAKLALDVAFEITRQIQSALTTETQRAQR